MKEVQCCIAKVSVISLPSSAKQISVGREEFACNPEHVFAFVLEKQQKLANAAKNTAMVSMMGKTYYD